MEDLSPTETLEPDNELLIDQFEADMAALGDSVKVEMPLRHTFTPGLYLRQIFMPRNTIVVSRRHLTEHPYIVTQGIADVFDEKGGHVERIVAPHVGITKPGTRRVLHIVEDCVWLTAHVTDLTDPNEIVDTISEHKNPLLPEGHVDAAFDFKKELPV